MQYTTITPLLLLMIHITPSQPGSLTIDVFAKKVASLVSINITQKAKEITNYHRIKGFQNFEIFAWEGRRCKSIGTMRWNCSGQTSVGKRRLRQSCSRPVFLAKKFSRSSFFVAKRLPFGFGDVPL